MPHKVQIILISLGQYEFSDALANLGLTDNQVIIEQLLKNMFSGMHAHGVNISGSLSDFQ